MTEQTPEAGKQAPAHRGPPIEIAEEVLDERGSNTAELLALALADMAVETGGRDDMPWARIDRENLEAAAGACQRASDLSMDMLHCLLAVDYEDHIELDYILFSIEKDKKVLLKVDLPANDAAIQSVTTLWDAAGWYEREAHDLFGVKFNGNPDMSPLLLFDEFEGYPGLKGFPLNDYSEW